MVAQHAPMSFRHFSEQLYCSGSEERWCTLPHFAHSHPGECMWFTPAPSVHAVTPNDMVETQRPRWSRDNWDALAAGAVSADTFRRFDRNAAASCLEGKHVLVLGESTTRDLYYELLALAGLRQPPGACMNTGGRNGPIA